MYDDGFALAVVGVREGAQPTVTGGRWFDVRDPAQRSSVLKHAVREMGVEHQPVIVTLSHSAYSLVQVEAPALDDAELREAMRWRIKDLIDFPVEQAVIDVFRLPQSRRPGAPELLYVVVARAAEVDALGTMLGDAGLHIVAIDIVEMAIRNLAQYLDRPGRPRAYLHLQPGQTVIEIADGSQVYLSRRILQAYDADADSAVLQSQMENLALEVQRSLDYFESQFALGPVDHVTVITCSDRLFDVFQPVAAALLTVGAVRFDFPHLGLADGVRLDALGRGVTAVGAALRGVAWAA